MILIVPASAAAGIALIALGLVLTPGPNMIYLTSRSVSQGRRAGLVSLAGVAVGFGCYLIASAFGLSAVFTLVPAAYTVIKIGGACYLGYLAWQLLRPGAHSPFTRRELPSHPDRRLFVSGLVTNLLNPKIALLYAALLPQFTSPERGPVWQQSLLLGAVQIAVALTVNTVIVLAAGALAGFLHRRPRAMLIQRWLSGTVLAGFAVKLAISHRP